MKKTMLCLLLGGLMLSNTSCGEKKEKEAEEAATEQAAPVVENDTVKEEQPEPATEMEAKTEEKAEPVKEPAKEASGIYGTYTLTDMIPDAGDKTLTEQDEKYIKDSKERTLNKTTLTLNSDGTFTREFPHPSGDGSMSKWTGTFKLDEKAGTLNMVAEMKGKKTPIDFKIVEKTNKKLSLKTSFGQIDMVYVYTKK